MNELTILPMDLRMEAAGVLTRMAWRGESGYEGDMRTAVRHYQKKYNLEEAAFAGMTETYEFVRKHMLCEETELLELFGQLEGCDESLYDLLNSVRWILGEEKSDQLGARIAALTCEDAEQPITELPQLVEYLSREDLPDKTRWKIMDACIHFDGYLARMDSLLDQAEGLLKKKSALIEPVALACRTALQAMVADGSFYAKLETFGLKLPPQSMTVQPCIMKFSSISLWGNGQCARWYGVPERVRMAYGALMHRFGAAEQEQDSLTDSILNGIHAMDDQRRMQILLALKEQPFYGQELAKLTGLSPATVSHHMNELANSGLVSLEKQGVRLQYRLNVRNTEKLLERLRAALL